MSVRRREWRTEAGETRSSWVVSYSDQSGIRRIKTFARKKAADDFAATASVEVRQGVHTADSASITIVEAGRLWLKSCEAAALERSTLDQYRQHLNFHIIPILGEMKLSQLSAPTVREFEVRLAAGEPTGKPRSAAMVKKARLSLSSLISDAQERGLVSRNVVRDLRRSRHRGAERRAERRQLGKLEGRDRHPQLAGVRGHR